MRLVYRLCGVVLAAIIVTVAAFLFWWNRPIPLAEDYRFVVVEGATLSSISRELAGLGLIDYPVLLARAGRALQVDRRIHAGHYLIEPGISPKGLLQLLGSGDTLLSKLTIPEGLTARQIMDLIQSQLELEQSLTGIDDPWILARFESVGGVEGWLFPDTYRFAANTSDKDIIALAHNRMQNELDRAWQLRSDDTQLKTPYEALIMASIIEKETSHAGERGEISGVFNRRLAQSMRLQTDPTVIYGIGEAFDGDITRAHLRDKRNVYNTYQHGGLPPTPIASPGRASLEAAVMPKDGTSLYFVADGRGGHVFSDTLEQHQQAVRAYLKKLRNKQGSEQ
jgi:UPF0755 protein